MTEKIHSFFVGNDRLATKDSLVCWDRLGRPKKFSGLRLRSLGYWLSKGGGCLHDVSLMACVLKTRYFRRCSFLELDLGTHPPYICRNMI